MAVLLAAFRDSLGRSGPPDDVIRGAVDRVMDEGGEYLLALAGEGDPVGVAQVRYRWSTWHDGKDAWLEDLYVDPSHRRLGLGRELVDEVVERSRANGCIRLELDVDEDNATAMALYRALGFSDTSKGKVRSLLMGRGLGL